MQTVMHGRPQAIYAVIETTPGTLAYPTASDALFPTGDMSIRQVPQFQEDVERLPTWSRTRRVLVSAQPGEASFVVALKPVSAGTPPRVGKLLRGLLGVETVTAGTKVEYTPHGPNADLPTLSIAARIGQIVYWLEGCLVNQATFNIRPNEIVQGEFSVVFKRAVWVATTTVKTAVSGGAGGASITTIDVNEPQNARVGGRFYFDVATTVVTNPDNGGQGFLITGISGNTWTFTPAANVAAGQTLTAGTPVRPFVPSPTDAGDLIPWRQGKLNETPQGGVAADIPVTGGSIRINNNVELLFEKFDTLYPTARVRGVREVDVELEMLLLNERARYLADPWNELSYSLLVPAGTTAGRIIEFSFPKLATREVEHTFGVEALRITRRFVALASTTDDEVKITFR